MLNQQQKIVFSKVLNLIDKFFMFENNYDKLVNTCFDLVFTNI